VIEINDEKISLLTKDEILAHSEEFHDVVARKLFKRVEEKMLL